MNRPPEAERDQEESVFTVILRKLRQALPMTLAASFVDTQGECIDYVSALDPFDAKVSGAHGQMLIQRLHAESSRLLLQEPFVLTAWSDERELWARRVTAEYFLVALLAPGGEADVVNRLLEEAAREFRIEVGAPSPSWEAVVRGLDVRVRPAVGWLYAPTAFRDEDTWVTITDVLGRWLESEADAAPGDSLVCFRVRTEAGHELTLINHSAGAGWQLRP